MSLAKRDERDRGLKSVRTCVCMEKKRREKKKEKEAKQKKRKKKKIHLNTKPLREACLLKYKARLCVNA